MARGVEGAAISVAVLLLACTAAAQGPADYNVLQFAFSVECLQAQYYSYAAFGVALAPSVAGPGSPPTIGGMKANLSASVQLLAHDLAKDEAAHVALIGAALAGGNITAVCPEIDIGPAFAVAVALALGVTLDPPFNAYTDDTSFLLAAFLFEDVVVTAYHGDLRIIQSPAVATVTTGILGAEAYHAGAIRDRLRQIQGLVTQYAGFSVGQIVTAASRLRAAVSGGKDTDLSKLVPAPPDAVVYTRTPAQVLSILFLGGTTSGGHFPRGIPGFYNTSSI